MAVLAYFLIIFAVSAALVSLTYVWLGALSHALRARDSGRWALLILLLGWPGALIYWSEVARIS